VKPAQKQRLIILWLLCSPTAVIKARTSYSGCYTEGVCKGCAKAGAPAAAAAEGWATSRMAGGGWRFAVCHAARKLAKHIRGGGGSLLEVMRRACGVALHSRDDS